MSLTTTDKSELHATQYTIQQRICELEERMLESSMHDHSYGSRTLPVPEVFNSSTPSKVPETDEMFQNMSAIDEDTSVQPLVPIITNASEDDLADPLNISSDQEIDDPNDPLYDPKLDESIEKSDDNEEKSKSDVDHTKTKKTHCVSGTTE